MGKAECVSICILRDKNSAERRNYNINIRKLTILSSPTERFLLVSILFITFMDVFDEVFKL